MKQTQSKKLVLNKTIITTLNIEKMNRVKGGGVPTDYCELSVRACVVNQAPKESIIDNPQE